MLVRRVDGKEGRCGIYGSNCPEWIIAMEACNSKGIYYVPLYDTLGANAVVFIINHAEVSIAFVQGNKMDSMLACLSNCARYLQTIVSFGTVGVSCYSWEEFLSLVTEQDRYCSFLPLEHIFDQIIETYCIYKGAPIGFFRGEIINELYREAKETKN
ncbi:probable CoA ligase CCL6 isoform X2 [Aristolochia californica]|uniref:probable CoA ligase CCL6 isoform X2 n=1 Tax=Aristolochia californica TaxID=171875 RepID=UPI0035DFA48B